MEFFFLIGSSFPFLLHTLCFDIYNGMLVLHLAPFQPSEPQCFGISLYWGNMFSLDQRPLLKLMPDTARFSYICNCNHSFLNVFSMISVIVPGGCVGFSWLITLFSHAVATPFSSFRLFFSTFIGVPKFTLMVRC